MTGVRVLIQKCCVLFLRDGFFPLFENDQLAENVVDYQNYNLCGNFDQNGAPGDNLAVTVAKK